MPSLLEYPIPEASNDRILAIAAKHFGLAGEVTRLDSERDLNALIETDEGRFVIKIGNAAEAREAIDMQAAALEHIAAVDPTLPVPRVRMSLLGRRLETVALEGIDHTVRVVSFLDGTIDWQGTTTPHLSAAIGTTLARLQRALRGFFHPAGGRMILWDARSAGALLDWVDAIADPAMRRAVTSILRPFAERVLPRLAHLPAQPIHNDFHRGNLLVDQDGKEVTGIIDFGDLIHGTRAQDVAVACSYAMLETPDLLEVIRPLISAFSDVTPLLDQEVEVIGDLIGVRLAQSITIGSWRAIRHPANADYILGDAASVADGLEQWLDLGDEQIQDAIRAAAGVSSAPDVSDRLERRRARVLSPGLELTYAEPLHLVRGDGVWLFDAEGRRYLDAYNNVVQVGHANRRVTKAVADQMGRLNTNTRYLTDAVVDYGEKLTAALPDPLEVCFFVNSGTEANDLAWRMAKTVTGNTGAVVTDDAYHGWTDAIIAISPEELTEAQMASWVATVPPPGPGDLRMRMGEAIARLQGNGHAPAALFIDATFSSDGIFDLTPGYLADQVGAVRERGGLFVADEVQAGLGRVGERFWGFAAEEIVPDIVTLGKPLGNGYPIGAVVTTRPIAEAFSRGAYFFSTFGGNPVAAVAAATVLRITLEQDLAGQAERVGRFLRHGLADALRSRTIEAVVRGPGTFIGVDLGSLELAVRLQEEMRRRGVLIGRTGPSNDVLKIRPPLVFNEEHAAVLLAAWADSLDAAAQTPQPM
jgi:4-aminobutyrate aminotransferase-like enzyme/Ser/Thr protein kinase RdoA (MazF antagonist)